MTQGICAWCRQERELVVSGMRVQLPELSEELKVQPAYADRSATLCRLCERWHDTQRYLTGEGKACPVHDAVSYATAARESFFVKWSAETRIADADLVDLLGMFFEGFPVSMSRTNLPRGYRQGFDIMLDTLPHHKMVWAGQDPKEVVAHPQMICVQCSDEHFHAFGSGHELASALAVGLNVYVRDYMTRLRPFLAPHLHHFRARSQGSREQNRIGRK